MPACSSGVTAPATTAATFSPVNPAPGTTTSAAIASLALNVQSHPQTGEIQATALSLSALNNNIVITVGNVTCGPNAATAGQTSLLPVKSLPIAGGTALVIAGAVTVWYRRRLART